MLGRSSGNHDWLLANASACVSCGFVFVYATHATHATQAIAFEWMKTGLQSLQSTHYRPSTAQQLVYLCVCSSIDYIHCADVDGGTLNSPRLDAVSAIDVQLCADWLCYMGT